MIEKMEQKIQRKREIEGGNGDINVEKKREVVK